MRGDRLLRGPDWSDEGTATRSVASPLSALFLESW
jgi:hypothetical protein